MIRKLFLLVCSPALAGLVAACNPTGSSLNSAANEFQPTNLAAPAALDEFAARRRETIEEHCARTELDRPTCNRLKALDERVSQSRGAIAAPAEMEAGETYTVTVTIADSDGARPGDSGGNAVAPAPSPDGRRPLGHFERVELTGSSVDIRPLETGTRELDAAGRRAWTWQVTPQGNGPVLLRADVIPVARTGDGRFVDLPGHTLDTLQVQVGTTWGGWLGSARGLLIALGAVLILVIGGVFAWMRRTSKPE